MDFGLVLNNENTAQEISTESEVTVSKG